MDVFCASSVIDFAPQSVMIGRGPVSSTGSVDQVHGFGDALFQPKLHGISRLVDHLRQNLLFLRREFREDVRDRVIRSTPDADTKTRDLLRAEFLKY
jgi:hypothetical protein